MMTSFDKAGPNKTPPFHQTMFGANSKATPTTQKQISLTGKNGQKPMTQVLSQSNSSNQIQRVGSFNAGVKKTSDADIFLSY